MLEPHHPAMDAAIIAIWPDIVCDFLQRLILLVEEPFVRVLFEWIRQVFSWENHLVGLILHILPEYLPRQKLLIFEVQITAVDYPLAVEKSVQSHQPIRVVTDVLSQGGG